MSRCIIITIMVLEMQAPHGAQLGALRPLVPMFLSYVLSFLYLGIYWSNHHHLLYVAHRVSGAIMWANLHLLFWLSLVPFVTRWMRENHFAAGPTMLYGVILLLAAIAYLLLQHTILLQEGAGSTLAAAVGSDWKGRVSVLIYGIAIPLALLRPWIAGVLYAFGILLWVIPDRRIERKVAGRPWPTDTQAKDDLWPHYQVMRNRIGSERGWPRPTAPSTSARSPSARSTSADPRPSPGSSPRASATWAPPASISSTAPAPCRTISCSTPSISTAHEVIPRVRRLLAEAPPVPTERSVAGSSQ